MDKFINTKTIIMLLIAKCSNNCKIIRYVVKTD